MFLISFFCIRKIIEEKNVIILHVKMVIFQTRKYSYLYLQNCNGVVFNNCLGHKPHVKFEIEKIDNVNTKNALIM